MKLLVITPHLSTGGSPQYLLNYLEKNSSNYSSIKVVEFSNFSSDYIVQKNKIKNFLGEQNVICLGEFNADDATFYNDKFKLLSIINDFEPDIIWFNEFPECYEYKLPPEELLKTIYDKNRTYKIIETTHNNSFDFANKYFIPDEFMFCSDSHIEKSKNINIKKTIWQVPIENKQRPNREKTLQKLNLPSGYLHVLNVGLFNKNKNQKFIFNLAEKMRGYKIMFHFIGNNCFLDECDISSEQLALNNCKIWGERSDVDVFMSCMDVFLFPSYNELNPLSVKEAISWNMKVVCKKCDNYTKQYENFNDFYILDSLDIKNFLIENLRTITIQQTSKQSNIKFALYTSFYNCSQYVDRIFDQVNNINYNNFTWFITDDFSSDDTKKLIDQNLNKYNSKTIKYVDQNFKKQMYWRPNSLIDDTYDYIVLIDADDFFNSNFLELYNRILLSDDSIYLLTSDFQKINENDNSLHSLSLVYNNQPLRSKINNYHPSVDYLTNLNYYCFGTLRCFKNVADINFEINDYEACAEDSYRCMFVNSFGKWLHIPRSLYVWNIRPFSESHSERKDNFNDNFAIAYDKLSNSKSLIDYKYNNIYKETCALNFIDINNDKSISIFSKNNEINLLEEIYFDKKLSINSFEDHDFYIIILNSFAEEELSYILNEIKNKEAKIICYCLLDKYFRTNKDLDEAIINNREQILKKLSIYLNVENYFCYIRHNYFLCSINQKKQETHIIDDNKNMIEVISFDNNNLKLDYKLSDGEEGVYTLEIYENTYNLILHKQNLELIKGYSYWTNISYSKAIIQKDILVVFKKDESVVFSKIYNVNCNKNPIEIKNMNFDRDVEAYSFMEVFGSKQYDRYDITVEKDDIVVDIGGNVGAFVNYALLKECKKIYVCEPNNNCLKVLNKYYGSLNNIHICDYAISNNVGHSLLELDVDMHTSGSAKLIEAIAFPVDDFNQLKVKTNTFKNFIAENKIDKIDFLKVDCEGGENFIFVQENFDFLKKNVKKIALEYHNPYKNEIKNYLIKAGFEVFEDVTKENLGFFYAQKKIIIINESGSLGDAIAWVPMVNEFAKQKNKKVSLYTPYKELFEGKYNLIDFYNYAEKPNSVNQKTYSLGCFDDMDWRKYTLQEIACKILEINYKSSKPILNLPVLEKSTNNKKYVCIATQSTSQCKYWNNEIGWNETVNYLNSLGYEVICIDRYSSFGIKEKMNFIPKNCIDDTGDKLLSERIKTLLGCEFFIGLGSGLSWLAWACNKPVIMISGFSDPSSEFYTPYRVHNKNVCNSCWNDASLVLDKSNWLWCPRNKNFECSKEITFGMVKEKIDLCISDLKTINKHSYNLKSVHILVDIESQREKLSIQSMQKVEPEIKYIQCINKRYEGTEWKNVAPINGFKNHGPGHYGAFQSFKKAILENFTNDIDALLIFEADCVLEVSKEVFLQKVNEAVAFCEKHDLPYFSFGPRIVNNFLESECIDSDKDYPNFIITDRIVLAHCVLITKKYRNYVFEKLEKSWDSPDLWFSGIFKNFNMGIVKNQLAYQTYGFSMIDNRFKWYK